MNHSGSSDVSFQVLPDKFRLNAGVYYVCDPEMFINVNQLSNLVVDGMMEVDAPSKAQLCTFRWEDVKDGIPRQFIWEFPIWSTTWGEGCYPVYHDSLKTELECVPTDSGYFAILTKDMIDFLHLGSSNTGYQLVFTYIVDFTAMLDPGDVKVGPYWIISSVPGQPLEIIEENKKRIQRENFKYPSNDVYMC